MAGHTRPPKWQRRATRDRPKALTARNTRPPKSGNGRQYTPAKKQQQRAATRRRQSEMKSGRQGGAIVRLTRQPKGGKDALPAATK